MVYIHNGILFNCQRDKIVHFASTWIKLEGIRQSEVNQRKMDKYRMVSLKYEGGKQHKRGIKSNQE